MVGAAGSARVDRFAAETGLLLRGADVARLQIVFPVMAVQPAPGRRDRAVRRGAGGIDHARTRAGVGAGDRTRPGHRRVHLQDPGEGHPAAGSHLDRIRIGVRAGPATALSRRAGAVDGRGAARQQRHSQ